jgi:hypothetical protein
MGQKKHKHARRTVAFYKLHHGFKEPFKVRARVSRCVCPRSARRWRRRRRRTSARAARPSVLLLLLLLLLWARAPKRGLSRAPNAPLTLLPAQILVDGNFMHATLGAK